MTFNKILLCVCLALALPRQHVAVALALTLVALLTSSTAGRSNWRVNQRWTWVGSIHGLGWVGLNQKYCGIVAVYCKTHTFHCP